MTRRECLTSIPSSVLSAVLLLGGLPAEEAAATHAEPLVDAAQRNKLLLLLRKQGRRGGLYAQLGAILGLYNRGQDILGVRISARSGKAIRTFGRVAMRHREFYYWGLQPDVDDFTTYFFLTDYQFRVIARGAELVNDKATALPPERSQAIIADLVKGWIAILDEL